ncbi:MAG: endonuclease domain-containing protein [Chloroflexota bacterium]
MSAATSRITTTRILRKSATDAEIALWKRLRNRQLDGARFRRQHPVGEFVVDFVSLEHRLVVEVDGGHHNEPDSTCADKRRQEWLEKSGYRVLRFWNNEVLGNMEGVLARIQDALGGTSPSL